MAGIAAVALGLTMTACSGSNDGGAGADPTTGTDPTGDTTMTTLTAGLVPW